MTARIEAAFERLERAHQASIEAYSRYAMVVMFHAPSPQSVQMTKSDYERAEREWYAAFAELKDAVREIRYYAANSGPISGSPVRPCDS